MILVEHVRGTCLHLRLQNPEPQMLSLDGLATFTISFQLMVQPRYPRGPLRKPLSFRLEIQRFHEISRGLHQSGPQKQTKGTKVQEVSLKIITYPFVILDAIVEMEEFHLYTWDIVVSSNLYLKLFASVSRPDQIN